MTTTSIRWIIRLFVFVFAIGGGLVIYKIMGTEITETEVALLFLAAFIGLSLAELTSWLAARYMRGKTDGE